jgi:murein DD-endopeptidase MepM/ murein hydrolase activator NlpD
LLHQEINNESMVNRNLVKLAVIILIGFATIFALSSLSAQTKPVQTKPDQIKADPTRNVTAKPTQAMPIEPFESFEESNPADELYAGQWQQTSVSSGWRDSLRKVFTDTAFYHELPLIGKRLGQYVQPFSGTVTSRFGPRRYRYHYGIDINLNTGDTVVAAFGGKVRIAATHYGYGKMVVIRHHNGLETVYGHFSKILVDTNQFVKAGDPIGLGGNTGRSYGSHLHFETRYLGVPFNPEFVIQFDEHRLLNDTLFLTAANFKYLGGGSSAAGTSTQLAKYHKIKSGDNLSMIAKRYGTSVTRLCQLNKISRTTTLQIGRTLRVR